uniref:Uncharacterized protein n=1 Tax=Nelumbo nucifera TaxID=4432 RepID=A0A822XVE5_NELNU|nr:TPA_asm: hypothetical protein HUJ06_025416 [Nelumbo nucifera]
MLGSDLVFSLSVTNWKRVVCGCGCFVVLCLICVVKIMSLVSDVGNSFMFGSSNSVVY